MEFICKFFQFQDGNWTFFNTLLTVFASVISVGYLLKPRLFYCAFIEDDSLKVKVVNENCFLSIKEIKCEMGVSDSIGFDKSKTLQLNKDYTLFLKRSRKFAVKIYVRDYVFKTKDSAENIKKGIFYDDIRNYLYYLSIVKTKEEIKKQDDPIEPAASKDIKYSFLRVRLLATNLLGVRKHYERIYKVDCFNKPEYSNLMCNYKHRRNTNKLIREELLKPNLPI